mmetsp:Transcript_24974/g.99189  ORF Transcript_24974/g.99189 Transcript_24974/m.99189 type:complete len:594 (-) Transcript_24974:1216-2997(-)
MDKLFSLQHIELHRKDSNLRVEEVVMEATATLESVLLLTSDCRLLQRRIADGKTKCIAEIPRTWNDGVQGMFFHPFGLHLIVSFKDGDNWDLQISSMRARRLRWQGHVVTSLAFGGQASYSVTSRMLVGTKAGHVFETSLEAMSRDRPLSLWCSFDLPVVELHYSVLARESSQDAPGPKDVFTMVLALRDTQQHYFRIACGGPTLHSLCMAIKSDDICVTHVDVQTAGIVQPRYGFVHQMNGLIDMIVAGTSGIFVADILLDPSHFQTCNVESLGAARHTEASFSKPWVQARTICYPRNVPDDISRTKAYLLLRYGNSITAISRLTGAVVEELLISNAKVRSLAIERAVFLRSTQSEPVWVQTPTALMLVSSSNEDKFAWKLYVEAMLNEDLNSVERGLDYCQSIRERSLLRLVHAWCFAERGLDSYAAEMFAMQTAATFEEMSLLMINRYQTHALTAYLGTKLKWARSEEMSQAAVLWTWLLEMLICHSSGVVPGWLDHKLTLRSSLLEKQGLLNSNIVDRIYEEYGCVEEILCVTKRNTSHRKVLIFQMHEDRWCRVLYHELAEYTAHTQVGTRHCTHLPKSCMMVQTLAQ